MKTKNKIILLIINSTLITVCAEALPKCRDCKAEDQVCLANALVNKLNCDVEVRAEYADNLTELNNKTNAGLEACDSAHGKGTLAANICRKLIGDIDTNMRAIAWASYQAQLSMCRFAHRKALSDCDMAYYECMKEVAIKRANCDCL